MSDSLLDLLTPPGGGAPDRTFGVVIGLVTNNNDPERMGRVKVRFPWLSDTEESNWARLAVPMAGHERGLFLPPEVGDEVLVAFEHGDVRFPYVLGSLWNGKDRPPPEAAAGKNNVRLLRSRSGHRIEVDDTPGAEKVIVWDRKGNGLVIDAANDSITLRCDRDLTLEAVKGKISIKGQQVEIQSQGNVEVKAGPQLNLQGGVINLN
jgi:uncharacterized protein involved in type VI secretion and phage assembly